MSYDEMKDEVRAVYGRMDLMEMVAAMKAAQEDKDTIEEMLKKVNARYDTLRLELIPNKMDETGIENIKIDGIGRVSLTGDMYIQVADKEAMYQWLDDHGFGDLIQSTVNSSTLKAFIKGRMKGGEECPEWVKITPFTRASITKS